MLKAQTSKITEQKHTFASFITIPMEAFCTLETLLMMPSTSKYGSTISIVWSASEATVKETSHSLTVNELTERHKLSPDFRTVSLMSSIARKAAVQILFKCLPTFRKR
jgi:hypothetical protein